MTDEESFFLGELVADLVRAVLQQQSRIDLILDYSCYHLGARRLFTVPFFSKFLGLLAPVTSLPSVPGELFADCSLAETNRQPNLSLGVFCLAHVVNNLTIFRAEAAVCFFHV